MKKAERKTRSLRGKVMRLSITIVVSAIIVIFVSGLIEINLMRRMVTEAGENQTLALKEKSQQVLSAMVEGNLRQTIHQAANNSNDEFWTLDHDFKVLAEQVQDVFDYAPGSLISVLRHAGSLWYLQRAKNQNVREGPKENNKTLKKVCIF